MQTQLTGLEKVTMKKEEEEMFSERFLVIQKLLWLKEERSKRVHKRAAPSLMIHQKDRDQRGRPLSRPQQQTASKPVDRRQNQESTKESLNKQKLTWELRPKVQKRPG